MSRGRKAIPVEKGMFQKIVSDLENRFGFTNRSALWNAVAATGYAKAIGLTAQVAMLKAKAFGTEIKTPLGKRGRSKGQVVPNAGKRKRSRRIPLDVIDAVKKNYEPSLHNKVDRAAAGSMKAAIALLCIDCSGHSKKEVALCQLRTCPLWGFRPYKRITPEMTQPEPPDEPEPEKVVPVILHDTAVSLAERTEPVALLTYNGEMKCNS